jgi:hypothetical protein
MTEKKLKKMPNEGNDHQQIMWHKLIVEVVELRQDEREAHNTNRLNQLLYFLQQS